MERFVGQELRPRPHIAVLFIDQIGSFVVLTPLLRGLRERYPGCVVDYFSGERTRELEEASPLIDSRFSIYGNGEALRQLPAYLAEREALAGPYDLAINCESGPVTALVMAALKPRYVVGTCYEPELRGYLPQPLDGVDGLHAEVWCKPEVLTKYAGILRTQYIGEIFCKLARIETDFYRTEVPVAPPPPGLEVPPVLIATGGNRSAKLWPVEYWEEVIRWCESQGVQVGLLGAPPNQQTRYYKSAQDEQRLLERTSLVDLRGRLTLPQVAGALRRARACIAIDNGILHMSAAVGTPTIGLYGATPWVIWAPRVPHMRAMTPTIECRLCEEQRFQNEGCLLPEHRCMLSIRPERVMDALREALFARDSAEAVSRPDRYWPRTARKKEAA